ncbi:uncharacterized protein LOC142165287 [Nicotiana tabacum]|uniref:Uncharacterized protein LOC142165287 n=1 Tax=Nicotiana tabacum TaxID=4097 RepID=A0AC58S4Q9_TOBAC
MSKIEEIDTHVKSYLYDIGYHRWSLVHATVNRTWTMASNIVESLNAGTFTYLGKKYNKELEDNRTLLQKMRVRASTYHIHTVIDSVKRFIICLQNKRCSCRQFQFDKHPYAHALAALRQRNESYENYCSPYYTRERLLQTYEIPVDLLPDKNKWNVPQYNATYWEKIAERPKKQRYKSYDELSAKKYKVSCGNYGLEGHNKRSCKNAPKKK